MNDTDPVVRIAAKGDGVTASGRFVAGAAPGDALASDGSIVRGGHYQTPPCRHFGTCGGCQLQHIDDAMLEVFVRDRVTNAALGQGLVLPDVSPVHLSPPASRRRATMRAASERGRMVIGFRESASHQVVDLAACDVLRPELFALVAPLRRLLARRGGRISVDVDLALTDGGADLALRGLTVDGLAATEAMLDFAREHGLARLTLDQGFGPEAMWEPEPVSVTLGGVAVPFPSGAFLQATMDGQAALVSAARQWLDGAATVVDLFAGLGTFAFELAGPDTRVLAVEAARDAHLACKSAAARAQRPVHALHRDLFRNPLRTEELDRFSAILLDPPRAGARAQVEQIASSTVGRVVYVSCNPASWARDAALLCANGYRLAGLAPVGQFRWSTHVELASLFVR